MDATEIKRKAQTWVAALSHQEGGLRLTRRMALLVIYAALAYLGIDAAELFDEEI
jgi:hypothetical protein